jgi:ferredoxin--NADP+ reductase
MTRKISRASFCSAELTERRDSSEHLAVLRFRPDERLSFSAGQFASIALEAGGDLLERPYSIASSPHEPFLEFFVELVPGGRLTPNLWELKTGDRILVRKRIVGSFTLDDSGAFSRHLMVATVTGVAPLVSIARTQQIQKARGGSSSDHLAIIHGASRAADFGPYLSELTELSRAGWLTYIPTISRPWEEPDWKGETGRVEDVVRKHADRLEFNHGNALAYLCGHPQMVENVKAILTRARFTSEQIKEEEYFAIKGSDRHSIGAMTLPA